MSEFAPDNAPTPAVEGAIAIPVLAHTNGGDGRPCPRGTRRRLPIPTTLYGVRQLPMMTPNTSTTRAGSASSSPCAPMARPTRAGRMVGKEYVRAMVAFLTNDSAASSRWPAGHHRFGRQYAGPPTNKPSSDSHRHRMTRCEVRCTCVSMSGPGCRPVLLGGAAPTGSAEASFGAGAPKSRTNRVLADSEHGSAGHTAPIGCPASRRRPRGTGRRVCGCSSWVHSGRLAQELRSMVGRTFTTLVSSAGSRRAVPDDHRRRGRPSAGMDLDVWIDRDPVLPQPIALLPGGRACTHQARLLASQANRASVPPWG